MRKKILTLYAVLSAVVLVTMLGYIGYRFRDLGTSNRRNAAAAFEQLRLSCLSAYLAAGRFDSDYFRGRMVEELRKWPNLLLVAVTGKKEGLQYLLSRRSDLVIHPRVPGPSAASVPSYQVRALGQALFSTPLSPGIQPDLDFEAIFQLWSKEDLYEVIRILLFLALGYATFTGMFLLLTAGIRTAKPQARIPEAAGPEAWTPEVRRPLDGKAAGPEIGQPLDASEGGTAAPSLFSPLTGLGWERLLEPRLRFELERAASFDQDLSLVLVIMDGSDHLAGFSDTYRQLADLIREAFPFKDLAFEQRNGFAVILPDRDLDQGIRMVESFKKSVESIAWTGGKVTLSCGLSARTGRLMGEKQLILEARRSQEKAVRDGGGQIIAFRADPEKYLRRAASRASAAGAR